MPDERGIANVGRPSPLDGPVETWWESSQIAMWRRGRSRPNWSLKVRRRGASTTRLPAKIWVARSSSAWSRFGRTGAMGTRSVQRTRVGRTIRNPSNATIAMWKPVVMHTLSSLSKMLSGRNEFAPTHFNTPNRLCPLSSSEEGIGSMRATLIFFGIVLPGRGNSL